MRACLSSLPYNIRAFPTATLPHSAKAENRNFRISKPMLNLLTHEKWVLGPRPLHQLVPPRISGHIGSFNRPFAKPLLPIFLTASHIVLAADSVPKFDVERTCRPATAAASLPGRDSAACQRGEQDARSILQNDWTQYSATDQPRCTGLVTKGGAPSYVELLTCLETAKQARDVVDLIAIRSGASATTI